MLSVQNIESELSYAYLHAIASHAGFGCKWGTRHDDEAGVDAEIRVKERLAADSKFTSFTVDVQLKATVNESAVVDGKLSYNLKLKNYNELRLTEVAYPPLLVVLFLPQDNEHWLVHSEESLIARRCAYWVILRGAPASTNETHQTVRIPKTQFLSKNNLRELLTRYSRQEEFTYEP